MIFHVVTVAEERCNECVSCWACVRLCVWLHMSRHMHMCAPSTLEAAGLWMSFPGDPEDCSKCVSVSLINSNTRVFGTCGQVNETQWEGTFSWFPPRQEAAGDGMRFSNSLPLSLSGPPLHQRDSLIPSLDNEAVEMFDSSASTSLLLCQILPIFTQSIYILLIK